MFNGNDFSSAIAGMGKSLGGIFGGGDSSPYAGAKAGLDPYAQAGQNVIPGLEGEYNQFSNPEEAYNNFAKNYQMSAGAQNQLHSGLNAISNSMAAQGLAGSGNHMKALSGFTQGLINQDMNSQWNNMLNGGRFGASIGQGLYQGGLTAAQDQAGLTEAEEQAAAQSRQNSSNGWLGALGGIGGSIMGGPIGGAIGSKIAGWL